MLAKLMHLEYQAPEGIILINRDHVIWFVFMKTRRFSSCSYWLELQEVLQRWDLSYNINLNFLIVG